MTVIQETVKTIGGADNDTMFTFASLLRDSSDGGALITSLGVRVTPQAGVLTTPDLEPGPATVMVGVKSYDIDIPDSGTPIRLWPLIEADCRSRRSRKRPLSATAAASPASRSSPRPRTRPSPPLIPKPPTTSTNDLKGPHHRRRLMKRRWLRQVLDLSSVQQATERRQRHDQGDAQHEQLHARPGCAPVQVRCDQRGQRHRLHRWRRDPPGCADHLRQRDQHPRVRLRRLLLGTGATFTARNLVIYDSTPGPTPRDHSCCSSPSAPIFP